MNLGNRAGGRVLATLLMLGAIAITGCSSGDEDAETESTSNVRTGGSSERWGTPVEYRNPYKVPFELRKHIRRDVRGRFWETLTGVPSMFILSYGCDNEGRKSLALAPYPPYAGTSVKIQANGKTVAQGSLNGGEIKGPFLDPDGRQTVLAEQATGAQIQFARVKVRFDAQGQCRVDDLNLKLHRKS